MSFSIDHLWQDARTISLSEEEKAASKEELLQAMQFRKEIAMLEELRKHPATQLHSSEKAQVLNTLYSQKPNQRTAWQRIRSAIFIQVPSIALSVFIVAGLSGGGLGFAAEYASPGDSLYGFKVYINEKIASFVTSDPEKRADWSVRMLERRIDELHALMDREEVSQDAEILLMQEIDRTLTQIEQELENTTESPHAEPRRQRVDTIIQQAVEELDTYEQMEELTPQQEQATRVLKTVKTRAEASNALHMKLKEQQRLRERQAENEQEGALEIPRVAR